MNILKRFTPKPIVYIVLILLTAIAGIFLYFNYRPVTNLKNYFYLFAIALASFVMLDLALKVILLRSRNNLISINKLLSLVFLSGIFLLFAVLITSSFAFQIFFVGYLLIAFSQVLNLDSFGFYALFLVFTIAAVFLTGNTVGLIILIPLVVILVVEKINFTNVVKVFKRRSQSKSVEKNNTVSKTLDKKEIKKVKVSGKKSKTVKSKNSQRRR